MYVRLSVFGGGGGGLWGRGGVRKAMNCIAGLEFLTCLGLMVGTALVGSTDIDYSVCGSEAMSGPTPPIGQNGMFRSCPAVV